MCLCSCPLKIAKIRIKCTRLEFKELDIIYPKSNLNGFYLENTKSYSEENIKCPVVKLIGSCLQEIFKGTKC